MLSKLFFKSGVNNVNNLVKNSKKYFGKNEKAIKMRIKSVSSIEKITKAMKMVC
jgi:hypothetical protein